jgi:hypothetical protein
MAEYTGSALRVTFAGNEVSGDQRSMTTDETVDVVDKSAGADVARTYLITLEDGTGSYEVLDQTGGTAATDIWQVMDKGAEGTLIWSPEGTASSGLPQHTVNAIVTNRNRETPYDDVVALSFELQFSGVVSDGTVA